MAKEQKNVENKRELLEIKSVTIESFLKSFIFSFLLFLFWGYFSLAHIQALVRDFGFIELLWVIYNVTISFLFLIRIRPTVVSMNILHWIVALITSFSGFFFSKSNSTDNTILLFTVHAFIIFAVFLGIATAFTLGRSYDFLPALRQVKTKFVYQFVRHPMYTSSIVIKFAYILKHPSIYNILLLVVIIILYDKRARYEEDIMSHNSLYTDYLSKVKYRFVPKIY